MDEENHFGFNDAAVQDKSLYLKRQEQGYLQASQSPNLESLATLALSTSTPICTLEASKCEHLKVGSFYEIDHSKLSHKSPEQLKLIQVVMVSEKAELKVSLRYPSIHSLRTHFSDKNSGKPDGKKIPALDEKYVMGSDVASEALYRRVPTQEFAEKRNLWSFWVVPSSEDERNSSPEFSEGVSNPVCKIGSCWSELKITGMVQWGQRRKIRFLGRHENQKFESLSCSVKPKETGNEEMEYDKGGEKEEEEKKENEEEEEVTEAVPLEVRSTRKSKRIHNEPSKTQKPKKARRGKQNQVTVYNQSKRKARKIWIDRWSVERYKLAEENMLKVMKAKGAVYGSPILRPALRSEARKLIGDTGLLDHLLKHMAGKVAPGGTERFRRRHNAEGAMEYWLESADLVNIRKEAGVQDPYWTPPPEWKLGDNPSQDPICAGKFREIKEEMTKLKQDMEELLASKKKEGELAVVTTPNSCISSFNWENDGSLIPLKEMYIELSNRKAKIEEQLMEISQNLSNMEEQMEVLKTRAEEPIISESIAAAPLLTGPTTTVAGTESKTKVGKEKKKGTKSGEEQDGKGKHKVANTVPDDKVAKIERLKSGFKICRPQGTFMWPNMALSPQVVVHLDDHLVVPTPPSASSSTTPVPHLAPMPHPPQHKPNPTSPVKPLAEKRPVCTTTFTSATTLFPPPPVTPQSRNTITLLNLNEVPLSQNDTPF